MIYLTHHESFYTTDTIAVDDIKYPQRAHFTEELLRKGKSPMTILTHLMVDKVVSQLGTSIIDVADPENTALIFAAGNQSWPIRHERYDTNPDTKWHRTNKLPLLNLTNIYAGKVAARLGGVGHISTDATACVSSMKVLMDVQNLIDNYGFRRVVVVASEETPANATLDLFGEAGASLTLKHEAEGIKPSAFDSTNRAFYCGQGAVAAVFEAEKGMAGEPIAKFLGSFTSSEYCKNPVGQTEGGIGYSRAIDNALKVAKLRPFDVNLVKTHGTGTTLNNVAEKTALGNSLDGFIATSYKQQIGHTMGASGLLETGLMVRDIRNGILPAIPNRTEDDDTFISRPTPVSDGIFLALAAGMGNVYSAALFDTRV